MVGDIIKVMDVLERERWWGKGSQYSLFDKVILEQRHGVSEQGSSTDCPGTEKTGCKGGCGHQGPGIWSGLRICHTMEGGEWGDALGRPQGLDHTGCRRDFHSDSHHVTQQNILHSKLITNFGSFFVCFSFANCFRCKVRLFILMFILFLGVGLYSYKLPS